MESPVVEVHIMDVYNDEKEREEVRGSDEEYERGGDIRGR